MPKNASGQRQTTPSTKSVNNGKGNKGKRKKGQKKPKTKEES